MPQVGEKKESYSYETEVNGVRKSVSVREAENGWIISIHKSWNEKNDKGEDEYKYEDKSYISSKDPRTLIEGKKEETEVSKINEMFKSIAEIEGMLVVP